MSKREVIWTIGICLLVFLTIFSIFNYLEIKQRYNVGFNDCLMDYSGEICEDRDLHLNDITLDTKEIRFICMNKTNTWIKYSYSFSEDVLNKCKLERS